MTDYIAREDVTDKVCHVCSHAFFDNEKVRIVRCGHIDQQTVTSSRHVVCLSCYHAVRNAGRQAVECETHPEYYLVPSFSVLRTAYHKI